MMSARRGMVVLIALAASSFAASAFAAPKASTVKSDETIVLFPTVARLPAGADEWEADIHGWIFEPSRFSSLKKWWASISGDDDEAELEAEDDDKLQLIEDGPASAASAPANPPRLRKRDILKARAHYFLVDNERGKRIAIRLAGAPFVTEPSSAGGHFRGIARLDKRILNDHCPTSQPAAVERDAVVPIQVHLDEDDSRHFATDVYFLRDGGISVISDIDDTIKITGVGSRRAVTRNTFLRPFRAVPGMAELYQEWGRQGATIHYVSACPWQLFVPLRDFMDNAGFPAGPVVMREFRWKDRTVWDFLDSPYDYKVQQLAEIIEQFPARRFILVGDSGQDDPEAFGELARRFPDCVMQVYIRDVTGDERTAERYGKAFRDVPADRWQVFKSASEIGRVLTQTPLLSNPAPSP